MDFKTLHLNIIESVAHLSFNRPQKANSINELGWKELKGAFEYLHKLPQVRVIILKGKGNHFCSGIDLAMLMEVQKYQSIPCEGRKREKLRAFIFHLQDCISAIEKCRKPVIAAIHGACVGGGLDIISACDMRYCADTAYFCIKEIDLGLVADIGTLQRLPKIIPSGHMAEMAYTGKNVSARESVKINLCNQFFETKELLYTYVDHLAETIASKSPLCIRGTKEILLYSRDHPVNESLNYMTAWNASMLQSNDLIESFSAYSEKRKPKYDD